MIVIKGVCFCLLALSVYSFYRAPTLPTGFSYITAMDPTIKIQARYAIPENFRGATVRGYLKPTVIMSTPAAGALMAVQNRLKAYGYGLVIYDAYRPQKAVDDLVEWASQPEDNKTKAEFYPYIGKQTIIQDGYLAQKSGHTRGSTIDLSIIKLGRSPSPTITLKPYTLNDGRVIQVRDDGTEFMCGHFDLFDLSSHHDTDLILAECLERRNLLRALMKAEGFKMLRTQWWHYTLENQPFPSTYFDFNVE